MRKLLYILLLVVLTLGCKKTVLEVENVEVQISLASIEIAQTTKAGTPEVMTVGSTVRIFAFKTGTTTLIDEEVFVVKDDAGTLVSCTVSDDGVETNLSNRGTEAKMYLPSSGSYDFLAISPAVKCTVAVDGTDHTYDFKYVGDGEGVLSDLLYSKTESTTITDTPITLDNFSHKFSQIQMSVEIISKVLGTVVEVGTAGMSITNQTDGPIKFNVNSGALAAVSVPATSDKPISFPKSDFGNEVNAPAVDGKAKYLSIEKIVFPRASNSLKYIVTSNLKVGDRELKLKSAELGNVLTEGNKYIFTLSYTDKGIELFLTITSNWSMVNVNANFGGAISYFMGGWKPAGDWETGIGEDAGYTFTAWIPVAQWTGDFGGGFTVTPEAWDASDQGWDDIVGTNRKNILNRD